jgi:sphingomyelin phosphodiesterase acid-like 3
MFVALISIVLASIATVQAPAAEPQVWLVVSDIHLDSFDRSPLPSSYGRDANTALFKSALDQMKRSVPNPAVVLLPGDFLMHDFAWHVRRHRAAGTPDEAGIAAMREIASAFGRAFPRAQFAITLGNNDAPCGDYRSANGTPYLAAVGRIWEPLVNRNHAAPSFLATFVRGGYYTAALPIRGLHLIVLNTIPFSSEYAGNCGGDAEHAAANQLGWLQSVLRATPARSSNVVMMHIPPGFDAFSTEYTHGFVAWRFLRPTYDRPLVTMLAASADHVAYALAGHAHRFDFRLAGEVPIVIFGSISPIYSNDPAFYAMRVSAGGQLRDILFFTFDETARAWQPPRSFDRTWGTGRIDAGSLAQLHARLAVNPAMRRQWDAQADGWPADGIVRRGTWGRWWRVSWCAQRLPIPNFDRCAGIERRVRALQLALIAAGVIAVAGTLSIIALLLTRRRLARGNGGLEQR